MARCSQPISDYLPGTIVVLFVTTIVLASLLSLWLFSFEQQSYEQMSYEHGGIGLYFDSYLWRVISFTFFQAALSTIISITLAVIFAKSLNQNEFIGKKSLLRILSITFVLPSLVVVTGLLTIYGRNGILAQLCQYLNFDYQFSIYGINGILIAHVFLNFPFATRLCYQTLLLIPNEQKQLSEQLGLSYWQCFRYLEWTLLIKQLLPLSGLIFMLCFSSFATVLALSGGPKYTTIEVAIYQAIRDFELYQAVILSLIQLLFCIGFLLLLKRLTPKYTPLQLTNLKSYIPASSLAQKWFSFGFIIFATIFIVSPLAAIIIDGIRYFSVDFLTQPLFKSIYTSIMVALCSAILALMMAVAIIWTNSRLLLIGKNRLSETLMLMGSLILAVPSMVLSAGFFILFYSIANSSSLVFILVVISNSFLALPFILKNIESPSADLIKRYHMLCSSLNISGINYLYFIEFKALKKLLGYSVALACIMSMGDFGIVALFGSQDFMTLPYYLYQMLSHYRHQEAAFISLLLLLSSYILMTLFENKSIESIKLESLKND